MHNIGPIKLFAALALIGQKAVQKRVVGVAMIVFFEMVEFVDDDLVDVGFGGLD